MKTAVVYARYSSDNQTEQSIEGQLHVCEDYAKRNDILILGTYIDRAMTGTNDKRPAFQSMIADSSKRDWDYVIVYKFDRFSRDKYQTAVYKKRLSDNGVKLLSAMENIPDSPEGIILEGLLEAINQYYSAELSQKVKRGMRETRSKGHWQGGTLRYGYKLNGKKIAVDEEQAEVVRYIFGEYAKGTLIVDIAKKLQANGIRFNGKVFEAKYIYGILGNEKYSGVYKLGNEIIDNLYPQIVDKELIDKVREKLAKNKIGKNSVKADFLLRKKLRCGYCGQSINGESGRSRENKINYYYKCNGRKSLKNGCQKGIMRKEDLENLVIDTIIGELNKKQVIDRAVKFMLDYQEKSLRENVRLTSLVKEQKQLETSLNNLMKAVEQGLMTNTTKHRLMEIESRLEELKRLIAIERNKEVVILSEKAIRTYFERGLRLEKQMLINYFIKEIVMYDEEIDIYFYSPFNGSPDESQGFCFYERIVEKRVYTTNGRYKHTEENRVRFMI